MTYIPPREMELMVRLTGYDSDTIESVLSGDMATWDEDKIINYRMEERAAIVSWLRETADIFSNERRVSKKRDTSELLYHEQACNRAANAIELGEHLK